MFNIFSSTAKLYFEVTFGSRSPRRHHYTETRSSDGSLLSVQSEDGRPIGGKLWQARGEILALDFSTKRAIDQRQAPRVHALIPPVVPIGSRIIVGVQCLLI